MIYPAAPLIDSLKRTQIARIKRIIMRRHNIREISEIRVQKKEKCLIFKDYESEVHQHQDAAEGRRLQ